VPFQLGSTPHESKYSCGTFFAILNMKLIRHSELKVNLYLEFNLDLKCPETLR
jgi:hypothetical protein